MSQTEVQLIKDAVIVNADVSNSAAIDVSKISGAMPLAGGSFTDDVTFTGASANIVFDKSDNALEFADSAKATFGASADLEIKHNNDNSFINDTGTGQLFIQASGLRLRNYPEGHTQVNCQDDVVELYYDNSKKLETTSDGATFSGSVLFPDNQRIKVGGDASNPDLQIYHDGSNTRIIEGGTGDLYLDTSSFIIRNAAGSETLAKFIQDGANELYHNNSKKFETTSTGGTITGALGVGVSSVASNNKLHLRLADSSVATPSTASVLLAENSGNSFITIASGASNLAGVLFADSGQSDRGQVRFNHNGDIMQMIANEEKLFQATLNGASELYYDNAKKFETSSVGATLVGNLSLSAEINLQGGSDAARFIDSQLGDSNALHLRGTTGGDSGHENLATFTRGGAVDLYFDAVAKLGTTGNGAQVMNGGVKPFVINAGEAEVVLNSNGSGSSKEWRILGSTGGNTHMFRVYDGEGAADRLVINSTGDVLIGTTSTSNAAVGAKFFEGGKQLAIHRGDSTTHLFLNKLAGNTGTVATFAIATATKGSISMSSTATAFNTSSDYRLKENVVSISDGITRLKQLLPKRFNFIADETNRLCDGFLAHEVSSIVPEAITGEKDAVDKDGNIDPQQIDQSKLVPLLVAAVQELITKVETLEAA